MTQPVVEPACCANWPAPTSAALFLDLDGTLAPIAPTPEAVELSPAMLDTLAGLQAACCGALAVVSGRGVADLDRLLAPLRLPVAGLHGAHWRDAARREQQIEVDLAALAGVAAALRPLLREQPAIRLEDKGRSLAVHFRQAPECGERVHQVLRQALQAHADGFALQAGKMVWEVRPRQASKGAAIRRFMQQPPFSGRVPVFIGDDVTDESGFEAVNALGGTSVKVGAGASAARLRLADPPAVLRCLQAMLQRDRPVSPQPQKAP